eukprot:gnl/MRDRNA2_/MRDRNA2_112564_c0_seq1.p1 gnl/MRDRNA2_/MRDRNA2_112564_c0~~gnl/MRDRNA2_/MRDRNA2_112564_c0_seq1.p1  ORF type:complete len:208 (+),score=16.85 gnl/MRDRNA2_/MRDRNA2_112564_c0_seq1:140-763(+)
MERSFMRRPCHLASPERTRYHDSLPPLQRHARRYVHLREHEEAARYIPWGTAPSGFYKGRTSAASKQDEQPAAGGPPTIPMDPALGGWWARKSISGFDVANAWSSQESGGASASKSDLWARSTMPSFRSGSTYSSRFSDAPSAGMQSLGVDNHGPKNSARTTGDYSKFHHSLKDPSNWGVYAYGLSPRAKDPSDFGGTNGGHSHLFN